jgi:chromosome segregation ATPase
MKKLVITALAVGVSVGFAAQGADVWQEYAAEKQKFEALKKSNKQISPEDWGALTSKFLALLLAEIVPLRVELDLVVNSDPVVQQLRKQVKESESVRPAEDSAREELWRKISDARDKLWKMSETKFKALQEAAEKKYEQLRQEFEDTKAKDPEYKKLKDEAEKLEKELEKLQGQPSQSEKQREQRYELYRQVQKAEEAVQARIQQKYASKVAAIRKQINQELANFPEGIKQILGVAEFFLRDLEPRPQQLGPKTMPVTPEPAVAAKG